MTSLVLICKIICFALGSVFAVCGFAGTVSNFATKLKLPPRDAYECSAYSSVYKRSLLILFAGMILLSI